MRATNHATPNRDVSGHRSAEERPRSYLERLLKFGDFSREEADGWPKRGKPSWNASSNWRKEEYVSDLTMGGHWHGYFGGPEPEHDHPRTSVDEAVAKNCLAQLGSVPEGFALNRKLQRFMSLRAEMAEGTRPLDWASAESLAIGSLLLEGHPVRLSGQDSERGTFSQRHSVLHDSTSGQTHVPLRNLAPQQARFDVINSPLCESGVLGFEYGYSLDYPEGLILWEAQFGDFWNVAQVIVDQFIASAEDKWGRLSKLTMLLPHGFEGAGPEHSSARLERFLLLSAEHNIQVTQPSTPAQYFHLLRRQAKRLWSKPLIALTPKSLLRLPAAVSPLADFTTGHFQKILGDPQTDPARTTRILLCSGKLYYELVERRQETKADHVAIIRIEQFYPLDEQVLLESLQAYSPHTDLVWVQEEPTNMGAWQFMKIRFGDCLDERGFKLRRVSRVESASPSTGSARSHALEQQDLIDEAFA